MPFFCSFLKILKKRSVTLQVRILKIEKIKRRKKASLSASASLTLEAALVLPLFLYAGAIFITLFQVLDVHRQVQAVAEHISENIGQTAYLSKYEGSDGFLSMATAYGYAELTMRAKLENLPVRKISLLRSRLLEDGEIIDLVVDYEISMPFSVLGRRSVKQTNRSFRRAWVGQDARSGDGTDEDGDNVVVYVGKNSTRYHVSPTCHYLYNDLTAVPAGDIENRRSQEGRRYLPCARCENPAAMTVYIMPSGEHYHASTSCSAIRAYARAVLKSEAGHLGACSYCSGSGKK